MEHERHIDSVLVLDRPPDAHLCATYPARYGTGGPPTGTPLKIAS